MSDAGSLSLDERKAWALRRGHPLWLWPEVAPPDWRSALAEIERACAAILAGDRPGPLGGDPRAIALAGYTSGMGPMLGWWIDQGLLRGACPTIEASLRHQLEANRARMAKLLDRARSVARRLTGKGIDVTVLKGACTAALYFPRAACRPMSDIDILVAPTDAAGAEAALEAAGYGCIARGPLESTWRCGDGADDPSTMISLEADDPWTLDLHVSLDVPGPPGASQARLSQLDATATRDAWELLPAAQRLTQPALLLHLAAHAGSGFHSLTLLRIIEVVLVARRDRASGTLDWNEFARLGRATRSLAFAYPALHLARCLSPADIPEGLVALCAAEAPPAVRRLLAGMRPATAHGIDRPSLLEHFAWTRGLDGWLRRLAADILPEPRSFIKSAAINGTRARGLLRGASHSRSTPPRP